MHYTKEQIEKVIELKKKGVSHRDISEQVFKRRTMASTVFYILNDHYYGKQEKKAPNVILFDIETSPEVAYVWKRWKENVAPKQVIKRSYMLSWAAKRLGSEEVFADALPYYEESYHQDSTNDYNIVKSLWELLDGADIVVAHNGINFDLAYANSRFAYHGLGMPSPYKIVDTLKVAKKYFRFPANSLAELCAYFDIEGKFDTDFKLWDGCVNKDPQSWNTMVEYNVQDIKALEGVYLKLRPYDRSHPNVGLYVDNERITCPCCGSGSHEVLAANAYTAQSVFESYRCTDCGHVYRSSKRIKGIKITNAQ